MRDLSTMEKADEQALLDHLHKMKREFYEAMAVKDLHGRDSRLAQWARKYGAEFVGKPE